MLLFEPINIGKLEIKNRIMMAAMTLEHTIDKHISEQALHFYEARARGGAGIVSVEDAIVSFPTGSNFPRPVAIDDDKYIPGLAKLSSVIKKHGARAAIQISHRGRRAAWGEFQQNGDLCFPRMEGQLLVAPSAIAHPVPGYVVPRELTISEIEEIIDCFGQAARRAAEAGYDIIILHCAHMYLCGEFLSPWANKRTDEYGGVLENRLRFVLQVIKKMKQEVGDDFPFMCRMNGEEPAGGNTLLEIREIASRMEKAGVHGISVSVGFGAALNERGFIPAEAPIGSPEGVIVHLAENIKKGVSVPVVTANKIRHVDFAESVLQQGRADMIALARPFLADPEWANKAKEGRYRDIRPCVSCCQGCVEHLLRRQPITCMLNPLVNREGELFITPVPQSKQKKILVIGGGVAGLEAATITASRGHKVTLWEKDSALGGQLLLSVKPPYKEELGEILDYYEGQLEQLGVEVKLSKMGDKQAILDFGPDTVILATGSSGIKPNIPGISSDNVLMARELLQKEQETGDKVVIIGGGQVGLEVAEFLAEKEKHVTVVEMLGEVGQDVAMLPKIPLMIRLRDYGVKILTNTKAKTIKQEGIVVERLGKEELIKADNIVISVGATPDNKLEAELKGIVPSLYSVGDCKTPGKMLDAIHESFKIGLEV